jgi:hypothetical protein
MKGGPPCTVCSHADRAAIDASRGDIRRVAARFGVTKSALGRHRKHAPKPVAKSDTVPPPTTEREALLDALAKAKHGLTRVETEDMPRMLNAMSSISKRLAQLDAERDLSLEDIAKAPAWRDLLAKLDVALRPYPEACRAMAKALTETA